MYIVVTGAAGFIGSNLVRGLNERGENRIIAVDNLTRGDKFKNLVDCEIADFLDKGEFLQRLNDDDFADDIVAVLHQGACSDTMEHDGRYMMANNYRYSVDLFEFCQREEIPFLYASSAAVYGGGRVFREAREFEAPLNVYGYSKFLFDQYLRQHWSERTAQVAGFRYFNVYGPREGHKGRMASVAYHQYHQFLADGRVKLFEGCDGYADGEQRRDFVYIDDVVKVNLYFLENPQCSGIYNLGTGRAQPFNDVATTVVNTLRVQAGQPRLKLEEQVGDGLLGYIPFPDALRGKYQSFTEADITRLREAGYREEFLTVEQGVAHYVKWLQRQA